MFDRIRRTIAILSYREEKAPAHLRPDVEFVEEESTAHSKISVSLGKMAEGFVLAFIAGVIVTQIAEPVKRFLGTPTVSLTTLAGMLAIALFWGFGRIADALQKFLAEHLGLSNVLTPHLGHKLEETYRILRG